MHPEIFKKCCVGKKIVLLYIRGDFMTDEKFCLKDGFVLREIAGEYLAVPVSSVENSAQLIVLNPVSAEIWKLLETEKTLSEIVDGITSDFSVSREEAEGDIIAFLEQLKELNFLR